MMNFYGTKVTVSPDLPKMQLSTDPALMLPDAFRTEINAWMRDFFGVTNILEDGQVCIVNNGEVFVMNPRTYDQLKKQFGVDSV
jgi:hypothetical protein